MDKEWHINEEYVMCDVCVCVHVSACVREGESNKLRLRTQKQQH